MVDFMKARGKWRHQHDGVQDGSRKQTVPTGRLADRLTETFAGRKLRPVRSAEFDAGDESALADLMDMGVAGFEGGEAAREMGYFLWQMGQSLFRFKYI